MSFGELHGYAGEAGSALALFGQSLAEPFNKAAEGLTNALTPAVGPRPSPSK